MSETSDVKSQRGDHVARETLARTNLLAIVDAIDDAIMAEGRDGTLVSWSAGAERLLGYAASEALGHPAHELLAEDPPHPAADLASMLAATGLLPPYQATHRRRDGRLVTSSVSVTAVRDADGEIAGVARVARDIGPRVAAERRIVRLTRDYAVLRALNAAIVRIRDRKELLAEACRVAVAQGGFRMAWVGMTGASEQDPVVVIAHAGDERGFLSHVRAPLDRALEGDRGPTVTAIAENRTVIENDIAANAAPGEFREECLAHGFRSVAALPLRAEGKPIGALVLHATEPHFFSTEEARLLDEVAADLALGMAFIGKAQQAEYLAFHDPLTDLPNRARFLDRLGTRLHEERSRGATLAVVLLDLARFHSINDTYGPAVGDDVLRTVAQRLRVACAGQEPPARIGSDAFGLLVAGLPDRRRLAHEVERILLQVVGTPVAADGTRLRLAAKVGIALHPQDGADAPTLFRNAEAAREMAKVSPEPYLFHAPDMNAELARSLATENRLRHFVAEEQFVVHYQPKVDAQTREVVGAEALLRWNDPENGLQSTAQFVTLLEETGLIVDTGRLVLLRVLEDLARWRAKGLTTPRVAVNISPVQLRRDSFVGEFRDAVRSAGGQAAGLDVEITESALLADLPDAIEKLNGIRDLGIEIAIDDFGTGYSSLSYLSRLPVSTLKIDRSFLLALEGGPDALTIVEAIISLAHALRFKVVAEGVETEEQARVLRRLACDQMQGFLFHGAMPRDRFEDLLASAQPPV
jgi:diguanylate cyclase (GGDEF)-like protein/PAS domain S-box-containing protein